MIFPIKGTRQTDITDIIPSWQQPISLIQTMVLHNYELHKSRSCDLVAILSLVIVKSAVSRGDSNP